MRAAFLFDCFQIINIVTDFAKAKKFCTANFLSMSPMLCSRYIDILVPHARASSHIAHSAIQKKNTCQPTKDNSAPEVILGNWRSRLPSCCHLSRALILYQLSNPPVHLSRQYRSGGLPPTNQKFQVSFWIICCCTA